MKQVNIWTTLNRWQVISEGIVLDCSCWFGCFCWLIILDLEHLRENFMYLKSPALLKLVLNCLCQISPWLTFTVKNYLNILFFKINSFRSTMKKLTSFDIIFLISLNCAQLRLTCLPKTSLQRCFLLSPKWTSACLHLASKNVCWVSNWT